MLIPLQLFTITGHIQSLYVMVLFINCIITFLFIILSEARAYNATCECDTTENYNIQQALSPYVCSYCCVDQ